MLLFYPTMIYSDLIGMGGYDGFANPQWMTNYGIWSDNSYNLLTWVLGALSLLWALALLNGAIALLILITKTWHRHILKGQQ